MGKKKHDEDEPPSLKSCERILAQQIREQREMFNSIPEGCRACGGPYPDCCDSCDLFDD